MGFQKGREVRLYVGDGLVPESFGWLGAVRLVSMSIRNTPVDVTSLGAQGDRRSQMGVGLQDLRVQVEGLFSDSPPEEILRAAAFTRQVRSYKMVFPNGDSYTALFLVHDYARSGNVEGLETFSATLHRSGSGVFVAFEQG